VTTQEAFAADVAADRTSARDGGAPWPVRGIRPEHHWWDWYAAHMVARENGRTPDEASDDAARHMEALLQ
jgi:hypothetical protein